MLGAYHFSAIHLLADIGGGNGSLIGAVLQCYPNLKGLLFDLSHVVGGGFLIAADGGDQRRIQEAGHVNPEGGLTDAQWSSLCEGLNEVDATLMSAGIQVVFHNHVGTYVETETETSRLLDGTDPPLKTSCV